MKLCNMQMVSSRFPSKAAEHGNDRPALEIVAGFFLSAHPDHRLKQLHSIAVLVDFCCPSFRAILAGML
jgi:hypothetical protein